MQPLHILQLALLLSNALRYLAATLPHCLVLTLTSLVRHTAGRGQISSTDREPASEADCERRSAAGHTQARGATHTRNRHPRHQVSHHKFATITGDTHIATTVHIIEDGRLLRIPLPHTATW
ncbi:hypothetical protein P5V15_010154 [Pogonomyrmex californicus]